MKYISIVGIGLIIWGAITANWFNVGFGALLFAVGFLIDMFKKRGALKDDKVFQFYRAVSELIRSIRELLEDSKNDLRSPKGKLIQGLYFMGMIDAASQASDMSDQQFLDLFKAVFADLDYEFEKDYQDEILLFHQRANLQHCAYSAITQGATLFNSFIYGSKLAPPNGKIDINRLFEDPNFPASVEALQ